VVEGARRKEMEKEEGGDVESQGSVLLQQACGLKWG
jgi:hypothetical protein